MNSNLLTFSFIASIASFFFTGLVTGTTVQAATSTSATKVCGSSSPLHNVRTFDGQRMNCSSAADLGRVTFCKTSERGVIEAGKVKIDITIETLKCVDQGGDIAFQKSGLTGRNVNRFQGFVEYQALDMVAYTPDLKMHDVKSVSLKSGEQRVSFTGDVAAFPGLLARNVKVNGEHMVVLTTFLRGLAVMGDARTGKVLDRDYVGFGSYVITLAESNGTLTFANQTIENQNQASPMM